MLWGPLPHVVHTMTATTTAAAPSRSLPTRPRRYGLMNANGKYFVHPYLYGGKWREWDINAYDAHEWVDLDVCRAAARTWELVHGEPLLVVEL